MKTLTEIQQYPWVEGERTHRKINLELGGAGPPQVGFGYFWRKCGCSSLDGGEFLWVT